MAGVGVEVALAAVPLTTSLIVIALRAYDGVLIRGLILLLFLCPLVIVIRRIKTQRISDRIASSSFILAFIFWYAYPALVTGFLPNVTPDMTIYAFVNEELITKSLALLSIFLASGVLMSNILFQNKGEAIPRKIFAPLNNAMRRRLFGLSIGACLGGLIPYLILGSSLAAIKGAIIESRAVDKPWLLMDNLGNSISPFAFVAFSAMIAGAAILWLYSLDHKAGRFGRITAWLIALFSSTLLYFDQGTRANLAILVVPMVVVIILRQSKRSLFAKLFFFLAAAILGSLILQFQMLYRAPFTRDRVPELLFKEWYTLGGTIDYFQENNFAISLVPSSHGYFRESAAVQFIVSPIPRFLWPNKPVSEVARFYTLARWNVDILLGPGNTFPGIVGQYYMNWGWPGPFLIGITLGWLSRKLDKYLRHSVMIDDVYKTGIGIMMVAWMFLSFRFLSPTLLYPVILVAVIIGISRKLGTGRTPRSEFHTHQEAEF